MGLPVSQVLRTPFALPHHHPFKVSINTSFILLSVLKRWSFRQTIPSPKITKLSNPWSKGCFQSEPRTKAVISIAWMNWRWPNLFRNSWGLLVCRSDTQCRLAPKDPFLSAKFRPLSAFFPTGQLLLPLRSEIWQEWVVDVIWIITRLVYLLTSLDFPAFRTHSWTSFKRWTGDTKVTSLNYWQQSSRSRASEKPFKRCRTWFQYSALHDGIRIFCQHYNSSSDEHLSPNWA